MSLLAKTRAMFQPGAASRSVGPIGVDFSLEALHLVQLHRDVGGVPEVRACSSTGYEGSRQELLESPLMFRSVLKRGLQSGKFHGKGAVVAMPTGMFRTLSINYQSGPSKKQEAAAILKAMKSRLDKPLGDYVIDYLPVNNRSKGDDRLALVAVSEKEPVVEFLELCRKAGLTVEALEIGPVAVCRLVSSLSLRSGSGNVLVINSGRRSSYMTLISGADLLFDQEVSFGEDSLIEQTAEALDMPEPMARDLILRTGLKSSTHSNVQETIEASGLASTMSEILKPKFLKLVEDIKRVCLYAAAETRGGAVTQVYLLGSIARWPGADELLSTLTGMDVANIPDPLTLFPSDDSKQAPVNNAAASDIVVATGAALRGLELDE
ncbi:MAG: pilus assembly protein PilM [Woeseiaceae bacterium]|nr:pilus assembly protein PilM [Woeseiaceae bacterium]